jgi:hypothetical protein
VKLTLRENPETIKRYGHIKPARGFRTSVCGTKCRGTVHRCTLESGHRGYHVAHGFLSKVVAVWESDSGAQPSAEAVSRALESQERRGLRKRKQVGTLEALWGRVVNTISDVEQLALFVMLIAFVGFAIHWMSLILR